MNLSRRSFVVGISAASVASNGPAGALARAATGTEEEMWLRMVRAADGPAFFDAAVFSTSGAHFDRVQAYLELMPVTHGPTAVVLGLHGEGLAHALSAELWGRWKVAMQLSVPVTEAQKNAESVRVWIAEWGRRAPGRVAVLACRRSLRKWVLRSTGRADDAAVEAAERNLLPGIAATPAAVVAASRAQHAGAAFVVSSN